MTIIPAPIRPKYLAALSALVLAGCASAPQPAAEAPDNRAAGEAAIRKADADWAKAASTKQVDAWMAFYSDDAVVLPPNEATATSKDQVRKTITDLLGLPGLNITWQATKVEVARSGDLGYSWGSYEMTMTGPKGKPQTDKGKYLEIWKKQADGSWKCAVDTYSSDLPPAPPPSK